MLGWHDRTPSSYGPLITLYYRCSAVVAEGPVRRMNGGCIEQFRLRESHAGRSHIEVAEPRRNGEAFARGTAGGGGRSSDGDSTGGSKRHSAATVEYSASPRAHNAAPRNASESIPMRRPAATMRQKQSTSSSARSRSARQRDRRYQNQNQWRHQNQMSSTRTTRTRTSGTRTRTKGALVVNAGQPACSGLRIRTWRCRRRRTRPYRTRTTTYSWRRHNCSWRWTHRQYRRRLRRHYSGMVMAMVARAKPRAKARRRASGSRRIS